jgi:UDP-2,4-diacetamido-2,4,6-trideoxy-beta-L-altropyranose hydrolase
MARFLKESYQKLVFLTEGSSSVGFGHLTRCLSLAKAFKKVFPSLEIIFKIYGDKSAQAFIEKETLNFNIRIEFFPWLEKFPDKEIKGSLVIADSYKLSASFMEKLALNSKKVLFIDDYIREDYPDRENVYILNYIPSIEKYFSLRNFTKVKLLLGNKYHLLREEFSHCRRREIKDFPEILMVTFGGDDSRNLTPKVLKTLAEISLPIKKIWTVIGKGFQNIQEIEKIAQKIPYKVELLYSLSAREMKETMEKSDISISACGQTLFELARCGVPTIGIKVAENQKYNVLGFKEKGFLLYAGDYKEPQIFKNMKKLLLKLIDKEERARISQIGQNLVDGKGPLRVVKEIME